MNLPWTRQFRPVYQGAPSGTAELADVSVRLCKRKLGACAAAVFGQRVEEGRLGDIRQTHDFLILKAHDKHPFISWRLS